MTDTGSKKSDTLLDRIKRVLGGSLRLALGLFLTALAIGALVLGWSLFDDAVKKAKAAQYETVKIWPEQNLMIGLKMSGRSKLVAGQMYYQLRFDGYPAFLDYPVNRNRVFILQITDADGFSVYEKSLEIGSFTSMIDNDNKKIGLFYELTDSVSVDTYARFAGAQVTWTLEMSAPEITEPEKPKLDPCEPGLTRAQRLDRLSAYGPVRQTGEGEFTAGGRSIVFFTYDNSLLACR